MSSRLNTYSVWILFFSVFVHCTGSSEKTLIKALLQNYKHAGIHGRPVERYTDKVMLKYGLSLVQILDLDEQNQVLSTNVWTTYLWKDIYLKWNPQDHDNITKLRIPSQRVWTPDVKLYNFADVRHEEKRDANLVIEYDGTVFWMPQAIFKSTCSIDTTLFPFDVQNCDVKLGTWTYDGSKIDLDFLSNDMDGFDMTDYIRSNEWQIIRTSAKKNVKLYTCCPEPYIDLTFSMTIRRKPAFYGYILILPCLLLSSLTLVLFWIPFASPAKMILGMNIFVAFFVLLLLLSESTPKAAATIPLIGVYYCLNMIMITVSTFLCVLVVNLSYHGSVNRVPYIVRKLMLEIIAKVLCVKKAYQKVYRDQGTDSKNSPHQKENGIAIEDKTNLLSGDEVTNGNVYPSVRLSSSLERNVQNIKDYLQMLDQKRIAKEAKDRIALEWVHVALVLDRIFFWTYVIFIVISCFIVFGNAFSN